MPFGDEFSANVTKVVLCRTDPFKGSAHTTLGRLQVGSIGRKTAVGLRHGTSRHGSVTALAAGLFDIGKWRILYALVGNGALLSPRRRFERPTGLGSWRSCCTFAADTACSLLFCQGLEIAKGTIAAAIVVAVLATGNGQLTSSR